jgi:hypothetical protein
MRIEDKEKPAYLLGYAYDSTVWTWTCSDVTKAFLVTYGI